MLQEQGALTEVAQDQRGEGQEIPRKTDRASAEVTHVRVQRLDPGEAEDHRAEHDDSVPSVADEEAHGPARVQRGQDRGAVRRQAPDADRGDRDEPGGDDGPEHRSQTAGSESLDREQGDEDHQRERKNEGMQHRLGHLEPFDRAEYRDRRRDDAVAVEQCGADESNREHEPNGAPLRSCRLGIGPARAECQGEQREDAAFPIVVGPHDDRDVLDAHHHDQRPDEERNRPHDVAGGGRDCGRAVEARLQRVERARAEISEHDAQRAKRQNAQATLRALACS